MTCDLMIICWQLQINILSPAIYLEIQTHIYNSLFDISSWVSNEHLKLNKSEGELQAPLWKIYSSPIYPVCLLPFSPLSIKIWSCPWFLSIAYIICNPQANSVNFTFKMCPKPKPQPLLPPYYNIDFYPYLVWWLYPCFAFASIRSILHTSKEKI